MDNSRLKIVASIGLVTGAVLGMAGAFAPTAALRGLAWGIDGVGLVVASALLTIYFSRQGQEFVAAGYLVFAIGEGLILSGASLEPLATVSLFGAGASLWAAALALISIPALFPTLIRVLGLIASALLAIVALLIFAGRQLSPLTTPLPFYVYPFFAATILGWAWTLFKTSR